MSAGEGAGLVTGQTKSPQILNIDIPFDGLGLISIPASETISPVFTMWITLVAMYTGMLVLFAAKHLQQVDDRMVTTTPLLVQFTAGQTTRQLSTCAPEVHPV